MATPVGVVGARHVAITTIDGVTTITVSQSVIVNKAGSGGIIAVQDTGVDKGFLQWDGTNVLLTAASGALVFSTASERWRITSAGKLLASSASGGLVVAGAALGTSATTGFLYIPTCAGTPTGTPATETGTVAMVYDTTNNKLYVYNGAWKSVTLA